MKTKMTAIFATLMIALMLAGFAYAHWSETLYINGTVKTGTLDAVWSAEESWDTEPELKNYSSINCYVDLKGDPTGHTLVVEVENAYPSIDYYQLINLENTGTIPLHIYNITIDRGTLPEDTTLEILPGEVDPQIKNCTQLHPKDIAYGKIHIHLDEDATELATYTFSITVEVVQWNYP